MNHSVVDHSVKNRSLKREGRTFWAGLRPISIKEWRHYFLTPLAYVFLVVFLFLAAAGPFYMGNFLARNQADLSIFFQFHPWLYVFLVPALSMRLWAEERKAGTLEMLLTLPVSLPAAVLAKFLAAWFFIGVALLLTTPIWVTVNYLGAPDNGVIMLSYMGSFVLAGACLAVSSAASACTRHQVIAFIMGVVLCLLLLLAGFPVAIELLKLWLPESLLAFVSQFGILTHYAAICRGVLDVRDFWYFFSLIGTLLAITVAVLEMQRA